MAGYIYGWVSTELPGYRETRWQGSGGGGHTAAAGVYEFRSWVSALNAGAMTVTWDPATNRIMVAPPAGANTVAFDDATGDALGIADGPGWVADDEGAVFGHRSPTLEQTRKKG